MKTILCVFGTRPEAIKFAPMVRTLRESAELRPFVCVTSQHREMLRQVLGAFEIEPDLDLDIMKANQDLTHITAALLPKLARVMEDVRPDWTLVQGDASSAFVGSLASFYARVPVGHLEAGLRTRDKYVPFPEEMNRRSTSVVAELHFAPTSWARDNLLREGVDPERIWVTGNTGVDALHLALARIKKDSDLRRQVEERFSFLDPTKKMVLVTAHRRESFGPAFENICQALNELAISTADIQIVYPVHLNPNVRDPVTRILGRSRPAGPTCLSRESIVLLEPVDYFSLVYLLQKSTIVLTDSGGIQEESPSLGKPLLVMRDVTERPEGVNAGVAIMVGTDRQKIVNSVKELIGNPELYTRMSSARELYGDGNAARRIANILESLDPARL